MECGEIWSEFQQKRVRVLYVGTRPGHFRSITKALSAAEDTDRIEVSGGKYIESIVITKSIEVVASDGETPEIGYRGTVIAFVGNTKAKLIGIEVIQHDKSREHSVITVSDGSPYIAECIFPSILITGSSTPTVVNNKINGAILSSGICLRGKSGGIFRHNRVHSHECYCIDLDNCGETIFEDNRIWSPETETRYYSKTAQKNRGSGVILISARKSGKQCEPTFKNNYISDCGETCMLQQSPFCKGEKEFRSMITLANDSGGLFELNDISGGVTGVRISAGCTTKFVSNTISRTDSTGIVCEAESLSDITNNTFHDCRQTALHVLGDNVLSGNTISGPLTGNGITISQNASATVRENIITSVAKIGIKISSKGEPLIQKNEIRTSCGPGILLDGTNNPLIDNNVLLDGVLHGIVAVNGAKGEITNNTVVGSAGAAIAALNRARPTCIGNRLVSCVEGILCCEYASGSFSENIIDSCQNGLFVTKGGNPKVFENQIMKSAQHGIKISDKGLGFISANNIISSKVNGIDLSRYADPVISDNEIHRSGDSGIKIHDNSFGSIINNNIHSNTIHNIICSENSTPSVRRNSITTCTVGIGITICDGGLGKFEKNKLTELSHGIIVKGSKSNPFIASNVIRKSSKVGILLCDKSSGLVCNNKIVDSNTVGVIIKSGACTIFEKNIIQEKVHGVLITCKNTSPTITKNNITNCGGPAMVSREHSNPFVTNNIFTGNLSDALLIEDHATGTYEHNDFVGNFVGIAVANYGCPKIRQNTISGSTGAAVEVRKFGEGLITANNIQNSAVGLQCAGQTGEAIVIKNQISSNTYGVKCFREGTNNGEKQGLLQLRENDISGSAMINMLIECYGHCTATGNIISGAPIGVLCRQHGFGFFTENTIESHSTCSFKVTSGGTPTVANNTIRGSEIGIDITEGGEGCFDNNTITGNGIQFRVSRMGNPKVTNCDMNDSSGSGIVIQHKGSGTYENNKMCRNAFSGLEIEKESNPIVRNNIISNNNNHGIVVHEFGLGVLEGNTIKGNAQAGILISQAGRPSVTQNTINGNENGILLQREGYGYITGNVIFNNSVAGISLEGGGDPLIEGNDIFHEPIGIRNHSAKAQITKNRIRECRIGITNENRAAPDVSCNNFRDNAIACMVGNGGKGNFSENNFSSNEIAIEVSTRGSPTISNNVIIGSCSGMSGQQGIGIHITGGLGSYIKNNFSKLEHGILTSTESVPWSDTQSPAQSPSGSLSSPIPSISCIKDNKFFDNCFGITCTDSATALISKNNFTNNKCAGVCSKGNSDPTIVENMFENEVIGYRIEGGATGTCSSNIFLKTQLGLHISGSEGSPEVNHCKFIDNQEGITIEQKNNATISNCLFDSNNISGLTSSSGAMPTIDNCLFMNHFCITEDLETPLSPKSQSAAANPVGVLCIRGGRGHVKQCVFIRNSIGIHIKSHAEPVISNNWLLQNSIAAIMSSDYGRGIVRQNTIEENVVDIAAGFSCETLFKHNTLTSIMAVEALENAQATFIENIISGKIIIKRNSDPTFTENHIIFNGVIIHHDGLGCFSKNVFMKMSTSATDAMMEILGGRPRVFANTFLSLQRGVQFGQYGGGHFTQNNFLSCKTAMEVKEGGIPHVGNGNLFSGCEKGMLFSGEGAEGVVEGCDFSNNNVAVTIENKSNPTLKFVTIFDCKTGVIISKEGKGSLYDCNVFDNTLSGVVVESGCHPSLFRCRLSSALESGALHREPNAHGTYEDNKIRHQFSPVSQKRPQLKERQDGFKQHSRTVKKHQTEAEKKISQMTQQSTESTKELQKLLSEWGVSKSHTATHIRSPRSRKVSLVRIPSMRAVTSVGKLFVSKRHASLPAVAISAREDAVSPLVSPKPRPLVVNSSSPKSPGDQPKRSLARRQTYTSLGSRDKVDKPLSDSTKRLLIETPAKPLSDTPLRQSSRRVSWNARKESKTPSAPEKRHSQLSTLGGVGKRAVKKASIVSKVADAVSSRRTSRTRHNSIGSRRRSSGMKLSEGPQSAYRRKSRVLSPQLRALVDMTEKSESEGDNDELLQSQTSKRIGVSNLDCSLLASPVSPVQRSPKKAFAWGSPQAILSGQFSPTKPSAVASVVPFSTINRKVKPPTKPRLTSPIEVTSPRKFDLSPCSVPLTVPVGKVIKEKDTSRIPAKQILEKTTKIVTQPSHELTSLSGGDHQGGSQVVVRTSIVKITPPPALVPSGSDCDENYRTESVEYQRTIPTVIESNNSHQSHQSYGLVTPPMTQLIDNEESISVQQSTQIENSDIFHSTDLPQISSSNTQLVNSEENEVLHSFDETIKDDGSVINSPSDKIISGETLNSEVSQEQIQYEVPPHDSNLDDNLESPCSGEFGVFREQLITHAQLKEENVVSEGEPIKSAFDQLEAETAQHTEGATQLAEETEGITQLTEEDAQLTEDTAQPTEETEQLTEEAAQLTGGTTQLTEDTAQLTEEAAQLTEGTAQLTEEAAQLTGGTTQLTEDTAQLTEDTAQLTEETEKLTEETVQLTGGTAQLTEETVQLTGGTTQLTEDTAQLTEEAAQLTEGTAQLTDEETAQLTGGTTQLTEDTAQLTEEAAQLTEGTAQLTEEAAQLTGGTTQLTEGLENSLTSLSMKLTPAEDYEQQGIMDNSVSHLEQQPDSSMTAEQIIVEGDDTFIEIHNSSIPVESVLGIPEPELAEYGPSSQLEIDTNITASPFDYGLGFQTPPCITAVSTPTTVAESPIPNRTVRQDGDMLTAHPVYSAVSALTHGADTICTLSTLTSDSVVDILAEVPSCDNPLMNHEDIQLMTRPVTVSTTEVLQAGNRSDGEAKRHLETLLLLKRKVISDFDVVSSDCLLPSLGPPEAHPHMKIIRSQPKSFPLRVRQQRLSSSGNSARLTHWVRTTEVGPAPSPPPMPPPIRHPKPISLGLSGPLKPKKGWEAANFGIGLRKRPHTARP